MTPPSPPSPADVAHRFIEAINRHDADAVAALMTDDHRFIDPNGDATTGVETLRRAWRGYFAWFPNYEITVHQTLTDGDTVALFGKAGGTFSGGRGTIGDNTWLLPAAWRAEVRDGRVALWQAYCDTEPVLAIMRRAHDSSQQP